MLSVICRLYAAIGICLICLPLKGQINTQRMMDVGRNAIYFDDYVLSIQYFNLVINAKPYLYEPYFYRGLAKFYLDDYSGAEIDCSQAISRNPYYPTSYVVRGLSRINLGKIHEATSDYKTAIELEPENRSAWHNLTLCYMELDSLEQADSVSDRMIRKWANQANGYALKCQIKMAEKDSVAAEQLIGLALKADPFDVPSLSIKAQLLMAREAFPEAETTLNEALRLQPKQAGNYINRALCRFHQDNYRGAMQDYDQALIIDSLNFIGHYNRGLLRANVGEDNLAIEDFNFIIRKHPDDMMAVFNRATLLENTGDLRGAIRDYTTVIKEYPKFLYGYERRAAARRKLGDISGAQRDEEHVLKEQIAHRYGYSTPTSRLKNKTRRQSERDISDYQSLVVADEQEQTKQYASEIRGKVQNRDVETTLIKPLARTYKIYNELAPDSALDLFNQAYDLAQIGNITEALVQLDQAISLNPYFAEAYYNRGILRLLGDQTDAAILDLSKAGELGIHQAYSLIKKNQRKMLKEKK
jgi:tetratricopeptide (TPR) repeat protein